MADFTAARRNMVESQIRTNAVTQEVLLAALAEIPREIFVPEALRGVAYIDEDLPLKKGRYLMEPLVLAKLLQLAAITPDDVVLDIGCGTGYSAALLSKLANTVVALESDPELAARAMATLSELSIDNVVVVTAPLAGGYAKQAPYDVIVFNGSVPRIPETIARQLADGGRLVAVVGEGVGQGTLMTRNRGILAQRPVFDAATPILPDFVQEPGFVF
ncbi:MAG: protein-L-isoaspartate O-methyltransferase [Alphaproteobacteria bacterium]